MLDPYLKWIYAGTSAVGGTVEDNELVRISLMVLVHHGTILSNL